MQTIDLISDEQSLIGATNRLGRAIKVYDNGVGPLWIHRNSMGISGIVRAQTWEDAYSICEDEFFPEASETIAEIQKEYGFRRETFKVIRDSRATANDADNTSAGERRATDSDYVNGGLPDGLFVRWQTIETLDADAWLDNGKFQESFGFRPNGPNKNDMRKHGIYAKDLNGDFLDRLTPELLSRLEISLQIETIS